MSRRNKANAAVNGHRAPVPALAGDDLTQRRGGAEENAAEYSAAAAEQQVQQEEQHPSGEPGLPVAGNQSAGEHGAPFDLGAAILSQLGELPPGGYVPDRVEVRLAPLAAEVLARLRMGLMERHAQMAGGRHVEHSPHAVIWLLEQIALAGGAAQR